MCRSNQKIRVVASGISKPSTKKSGVLDDGKRKKWEEATEREKTLLDRLPEDNVFIASSFAPQLFPLSEAIDIFREMAVPEMLDHSDGEVHVNIQLNARTSKKTKFIHGISATVQVPHRPSFLRQNKIIVFTGDQAEAEAAKAAGALDAGAENLIAQIEHGLYHWEAFDNVVCHKDFFSKLSCIRKLLRDRYPAGNRVGENVMEMLELHSLGIVITSSKHNAIPEMANVQLPLGCLSDPKEHLEANLLTYVNTIHESRPARVAGKFIEKMEIIAPPCPISVRLELFPEPEVKKPQKGHKKAPKQEETDAENMAEAERGGEEKE